MRKQKRRTNYEHFFLPLNNQLLSFFFILTSSHQAYAVCEYPLMWKAPWSTTTLWHDNITVCTDWLSILRKPVSSEFMTSEKQKWYTIFSENWGFINLFDPRPRSGGSYKRESVRPSVSPSVSPSVFP